MHKVGLVVAAMLSVAAGIFLDAGNSLVVSAESKKQGTLSVRITMVDPDGVIEPVDVQISYINGETATGKIAFARQVSGDSPHTVQETLSDISLVPGKDWQISLKAPGYENISKTNITVEAGKTVEVMLWLKKTDTPKTYTVQVGDSWWIIANKHFQYLGLSVEHWKASNQEPARNELSVGITLEVPELPRDAAAEGKDDDGSGTTDSVDMVPCELSISVLADNEPAVVILDESGNNVIAILKLAEVLTEIGDIGEVDPDNVDGSDKSDADAADDEIKVRNFAATIPLPTGKYTIMVFSPGAKLAKCLIELDDEGPGLVIFLGLKGSEVWKGDELPDGPLRLSYWVWVLPDTDKSEKLDED